METSATVPSVVRAIFVTAEQRERALSKFSKYKSCQRSILEAEYEAWTSTYRNLKSFLQAIGQIKDMDTYGPMIIWMNIWTVMEIEILETGHTVLGELIGGMTSCNPESLKKFVENNPKPLMRCFEYMELLFNE